MPDQHLYHLNIEWDPGERSDWFVLLSRQEERRLWDALTEGVKNDFLNEFFLGPIGQTTFEDVVSDLRQTKLRQFLSPKHWSPKWDKR